MTIEITKKLRLALFISGSGTTMTEVLKACQSGKLNAEVALIVASKKSAGGIQKALDLNFPKADIIIAKSKKFDSSEEFGQYLLWNCRLRDVQLIAQCGWLIKTPLVLIRAYENWIINQHPGPLDGERPGFGGQDMYGLTVHRAVINFSKTISRAFYTEATVHRVTKDYDSGAILGRKELKVLETDDAESLQQRLLPLEHALVLEILKQFAKGTVKEYPCTKTLINPGEEDLLKKAKEEAIRFYKKIKN
jgi:phosphoribosylglycinamide formyltransferase-1